MPIVSPLPSTAENGSALGLGDEAALAHERGDPPEARPRHLITRSALGHPDATSAVRAGRVSAVDGNACRSRPGPRLVVSRKLLAGLLHPDRFAGRGPAGGARPISLR